MTKCIICGKETETFLCEDCGTVTDLEELCKELIGYHLGCGEKPLWEELLSRENDKDALQNIVFAITEDLPSPERDYWRILSVCTRESNVYKARRQWFYEIFENIKLDIGLSDEKKKRLYGIALGAYCGDYDYESAEKVATFLSGEDELPWQCYFNLADYYTKTRRYDLADEVIAECLQLYQSDNDIFKRMQELAEENTKKLENALAGKPEYLPNPKENKEEIRKKYIDFLSSIGIDAFIPETNGRCKAAIPRDQYPPSLETRDTDFNCFVAFDLETTGRSSQIDSIIEIGAIKVIDGCIIESKEFCFQEFVCPLDHKKVSKNIEDLTGITNVEVYAARPIWEVLPDFMKFVGDSVLVGFNCIRFDCRFMERAGRYSNLIIQNKYFDVQRYANQFAEQLGIELKEISLQRLSEALGVENPCAHRALADAISTAKVYLELKKRQAMKPSISITELLNDLDNW